MDSDRGEGDAPRRIGRQLLFNNYRYRKQNSWKKGSSLEAIYWKCTKDRCKARVVEYPLTGIFKENKDWVHSCNYDAAERTKDIALERLRELTLAALNGDKATEIIRRFLEELPRETISLLPNERALADRVRKLAKSKGLVLGRSSFEDFYRGDEEQTGLEVETEREGQPMLASPNVNVGLDLASPEASTSGAGGAPRCHEQESQSRSTSSRLRMLKKRQPSLKLVDEEGRDLGNVAVDRIQTVGDSGSARLGRDLDYDNLRRIDDNDAVDAIFEGDDPANDFPDEFDYEPEPDVKPPLSTGKRSPKAKTISTSSHTRRILTGPRRTGLKSGQRCFVCGDDLLVSEILSSSESEQTFLKACTYLNVKSQNEWFPRKSNKHGQFYSFCESCTNEITRIHQLYKKVEEFQSLIFRKVEQVEKRLTEGEILDNWLADAPVTSARRFEGFRKQVLINYKNKLKLRREIRIGAKMGQPLTEIQPITSAHMFATDPAGANALHNVPGNWKGKGKRIATTKAMSEPSHKTPTAKRGRGRPKSKKTETEESVETKPIMPDLDHHSNSDTDGVDYHDFDDANNDLDGETEPEKKFWVDDPTRLNVQPDKNVDDDENHDGSSSNSDDEDDNSEQDEEWTKSIRSGSECPTRKRKRPGPRKRKTSVSKSTDKKGAVGTGISDDQNIHEVKSATTSQAKRVKPVRKSHSRNIEFPDTVLTKDGRLFMSGIEIIKSAPGLYPRRPQIISFTCGACEKVTACFHRMKSHICGLHLGLYKCHICGRQISDARNLQKHIQAKHSQTVTRTPCPVCAKPMSGEERHMRYHIWSHLSEEERKDPKYQSYARPPKRDPDFKIPNSRLQTFMCSSCPKSFFRVGALRSHELTVHSGDATENFQCQYCGKFYKSKGSLRGHSKTCMKTTDASDGIESLRKFSCLHCPVILKSQRIRGLHMRKFHPNPASLPFVCPKCPRRFSTRSGFKVHKRICVEGLSTAGSSRKGGRGRQRTQRDNQLLKIEDDSPPVIDQHQFLHPHPYLNVSGGSVRSDIATSTGSTNDTSSLSTFPPNLFGNYPGGSGNHFQTHQQ